MSEDKKDTPKKDGYFKLRDAGSTLYDGTQQKGLHGHVPAHLKLTPIVRKALASKHIIDISKSAFDKLLKELGMEVKKGVIAVKSDTLTAKQQELLDEALKLGVISTRNKAFFIDKDRVASGEGGLLKKMKDRSFAARLKKEVEISKLAAEMDEEETVNSDTGNASDDIDTTESGTGTDAPDNTETGEVVDCTELLLAAVDKELIKKSEEGVYMFGEFAIGEDDEQALAFLADKDNADIKTTIENELKEGE